jgi:two-component system sensor histidine kinase CreC
VFTLRDAGPGVSDFALPQLGTRFFSLPRPRDGRRGSGLGLAIVRQAAALHGGSVAFERASPGLLVTVRLPL